MPIYEYKCGSCEHRFEALQRINEDGAKLSCPRCGAPWPEKIISACCSTMGASSFEPSTNSGCSGGCCCGN